MKKNTPKCVRRMVAKFGKELCMQSTELEEFADTHGLSVADWYVLAILMEKHGETMGKMKDYCRKKNLNFNKFYTDAVLCNFK